jgi:Zn-finger nucleic acid-binding protein
MKERAYRGRTLRCPACDEPMRTELTSTAEVDACDGCGGLWLDWFDGEVSTIAVEAEAARVERGAPPPGMLAPPRRSGSRACPRCGIPLEVELRRFADATADELVQDVELLRCGECAGAFVPRGSAHLLLDRATHGRAPSLREALGAVLRRVLARR